MADDVLVTWNAETRDFVDEVLTANQVLKENERRLQKADKASKDWAKTTEKSTSSMSGLLEQYIGAEAAMQVFNGILDAQTDALNKAADAAVAMAQANDQLTGVQGGTSGAIAAAQARSQGALATAGDPALRRAAQEARLAEFDAQIASSDNIVERLAFSVGKYGEQLRQSFGRGTEQDQYEALVEVRDSMRLTAEEARRFNETQAVVRDTD